MARRVVAAPVEAGSLEEFQRARRAVARYICAAGITDPVDRLELFEMLQLRVYEDRRHVNSRVVQSFAERQRS